MDFAKIALHGDALICLGVETTPVCVCVVVCAEQELMSYP